MLEKVHKLIMIVNEAGLIQGCCSVPGCNFRMWEVVNEKGEHSPRWTTGYAQKHQGWGIDLPEMHIEGMLEGQAD